MKKTSIYLEPELDLELARVAHGDGVTKAELIRRTLRRAIQQHPQPQITAIGLDRDPKPAELSQEDREIADLLLAEHDVL
ncbi:MAG: CopG family transcriptional regulator [Solirubrobacterales bacterium]